MEVIEMIDQALSEIKERLAVDGYELSVTEVGDGEINIIIKAGPEACSECLSPKPLLERMIANELKQKGIQFTKLNISLPA